MKATYYFIMFWWARIICLPFIVLGLLSSIIVSNIMFDGDPIMDWLRGLDTPDDQPPPKE